MKAPDEFSVYFLKFNFRDEEASICEEKLSFKNHASSCKDKFI